MPITVLCPSCSARSTAPDAAAGKQLKCPSCGNPLIVPGQTSGAFPAFEVVEEVEDVKRRTSVAYVVSDDDEWPRDEDREERHPRRRHRDDDELEERSLRQLEKDSRVWSMFLHLSLLIGWIGLIALIVIWQTKKDELPKINRHGKNALNWIISSTIYAMVCIPLIFVCVGYPLLLSLVILNIVFSITAGVKANNGQVWKYPLAIPFLK